MLQTAEKMTFIWIYIFKVVNLFEVAVAYGTDEIVRKINVRMSNPYF